MAVHAFHSMFYYLSLHFILINLGVSTRKLIHETEVQIGGFLFIVGSGQLK
jgi:hypothetical protein